MARAFGVPDPEKCRHYAGFTSHLGRDQLHVLYWVLFVLVITMLFLSSWKYAGSAEKASAMQVGSGEHRRTMKRCMYHSAACASVAVVAVVTEVFALLALQFCAGEDLMSLYWSTWTALQAGSLVAMLGIMLSVWNTIRGTKNPPWALALGTPVLVVAGIGHAMQGAVKKRVKKMKTRVRTMKEASRSRRQSQGRHRTGSYPTLPFSRDDTLRGDESDSDRKSALSSPTDAKTQGSARPSAMAASPQYSARLVGYTAYGVPIVQFLENSGDLVIEGVEVPPTAC